MPLQHSPSGLPARGVGPRTPGRGRDVVQLWGCWTQGGVQGPRGPTRPDQQPRGPSRQSSLDKGGQPPRGTDSSPEEAQFLVG